MTGAQEGGEFFTPPSLVRTIVNVIEPDRGLPLDAYTSDEVEPLAQRLFLHIYQQYPGSSPYSLAA
jgi:hypothetical protein